MRNYERILANLRDLDQSLIRRAKLFMPEETAKLTTALEHLKEVGYALYEDDTPPRFRRLKDEIEPLVDRIEGVIMRNDRDAVASVTAQAGQLFGYLKRVREGEDKNLTDENVALREQIKQYELQAKTRDFASRKLGKVRSAEAAKAWSAYYDRHVDKERLAARWAWWARLRYWGDNFYLLERKWAQWRSIWLGLIMVASISLGVWAAVQLSDGVPLGRIFAEKLLLLPLYLVLGVCFAFSSRNYRINANLLADYRHRQIVAKILENVVINNAFDDKDDMKREMLQQGAKALFVSRKIGHLNKESVEEFPIIELVKAIKNVK